MTTTDTFRNLFLFLFVVGASFFLSAQVVNLKITETSDVHGALVPYDLINNQETKGSLVQVYTYVLLFGEEAPEPEIK
jgi:2',3'-cyclic-nucleotide 2'-phosphodiesterase/3'-nucleotidase